MVKFTIVVPAIYAVKGLAITAIGLVSVSDIEILYFWRDISMGMSLGYWLWYSLSFCRKLNINEQISISDISYLFSIIIIHISISFYG